MTYGGRNGIPIRTKAADGTGEPKHIVDGRKPSSYAPDGRLAFTKNGPATGRDIWIREPMGLRNRS